MPRLSSPRPFRTGDETPVAAQLGYFAGIRQREWVRNVRELSRIRNQTPVAAQLGYLAGRIWTASGWALPLARVVRKMTAEADCVSTRMGRNVRELSRIQRPIHGTETGLLGGEDLDGVGVGVAAGVGGAEDDGGGGLCFNANGEECPRIIANPETNPWH